MIPVITSLPVSPRLGAPLGLYLTAAAVGTLARLTGREAVLAVNLLGARSHTTKEAEHYLNHAEAVCGPARRWIDADADWDSLLAQLVSRGTAEGWLKARETSICHCQCGLLEYPAETPPDLDKRSSGKVYERRPDGLHCLLCDSLAKAAILPSLCLKLPSVEALNVTPAWAEREINCFRREFAERDMLVSRRRETGLSAVIGSQCFNLDPDLALMLLPYALHQEGMAAEVIVIGNRTLKQAFLAAAVALRLGLPSPAIVALPMLTFTDEAGHAAMIDDAAIMRHGGATIRTVLAMAMGPTPKEVKLATRSLHLATTSLAAVMNALPQTSDLPPKPWSLLGKNKIEALLASMRRHQPLSHEQTCVLDALRT